MLDNINLTHAYSNRTMWCNIDQVDNQCIIIGKSGCANVTPKIKAMVTYSFGGNVKCVVISAIQE